MTLEGHGDLTFNAHIQEVQRDKGIAVVFVEGLGQKFVIFYAMHGVVVMPTIAFYLRQVVRSDAIKLLVKPNQFGL